MKDIDSQKTLNNSNQSIIVFFILVELAKLENENKSMKMLLNEREKDYTI